MKERNLNPKVTNNSLEKGRYIYLLFFSLVLLLNSGFSAYSQIKVVFSENFDNASSLEPWAPYKSTGWIYPTNTLQSVSGHGKVLHVKFPANTVGDEHGLGNYRISLDKKYKELYLSWEYFLPSYFDFGAADGLVGGKFFGGLAGGSMCAIPNLDATDVDGWCTMLMFQDGFSTTYNYFKGSSYNYGGWPNGSRVANVPKGVWRRMTIRIKINDGDQSNGIFEAYDNDVLVYQQPGIKIVNSSHPEYLIEHIYLNSFFGGAGKDYMSPIDQFMEFDNIIAFNYPEGSSGYRSGPSEQGRVLQMPQVTSYHPESPNKFTPFNYTDANGTISSHCAFYQPIDHIEGFQTSTIQISGATSININVNKFNYDNGINYAGYKQILKIYQGTGAGRVLKQTWEKGINTATGSITISGNSATIEWQAGQGNHNGFSLNYTSNGTGSGMNFACGDVTPDPGGGGTTTAPPTAPSNLSYSNLKDESLTLNWSDNSNNEASFEIERSGPNGTNIKLFQAGANSTSFLSNSLIGNTSYAYRIRAYNDGGYSAYSNILQVTTSHSLPNAPTELTATGKTSNSVSLKWTDNSNIEEGFKIERSLASNTGFAEVATVTTNVTSYTNSTCSSSTAYYYRVRAFNPAGNTDYTPVLSVKTDLSTAAPAPDSKTVYIDPNNNQDAMADGSINNPYDSWSDIKWQEGFSYLQKRGTTSTVDKIMIGANKVSIGAYGEGDLPVISSETSTYLISGFEKSAIKISNLNLLANKAASCIYFLGNSQDTIMVDHCVLTGNANAIKVVDGTVLLSKYNKIISEYEGIFSTATSNEIFYNVFEMCNTAVNIMGNKSQARIFNNVFVNNIKSVAVSFADLTLYNNIFYMTTPAQMAVNHGTGNIVSDNNLFYPEQKGFIAIENKLFNDLEQLQHDMKIDINSLNEDPEFMDLETGNYTLKSTSPAVNAGKNLDTRVDFKGNKVPLFSKTDIGAFEFNGNLNLEGKVNEEVSTLALYPNPVSTGEVNILATIKQETETDNITLGSTELKIVDMTGKILYSESVEVINRTYSDRIDISKYSNGLYFIILQYANKVIKEKLIISK